jgi:glutamyl-tRNA synthetase
VEAVGNRLGGPHDVAEALGYFYGDDFAYDPEAVAKHLQSGEAAAHLTALADALEALPVYTLESIESALRELATARGVKAAALIHPARVALTGRSSSPGIFEVLYLLGRAKSIERLRRGRDIVHSNRALPAPARLDPGAPPAGLAPPAADPEAGIQLASDWSDAPPADA